MSKSMFTKPVKRQQETGHSVLKLIVNMQVQLITPKQVKAIRAAMAAKKLLEHKEQIVDSYTKGRTTHISEMHISEAGQLLTYLNGLPKEANPKSKLMSKLFAMCHEMGWIKSTTVVDGPEIKIKKDYSAVYNWVAKYGYLKKPLRDYTYNELPKLVTQLEKHIYEPFIQNLSSQNKQDNPFL